MKHQAFLAVLLCCLLISLSGCSRPASDTPAENANPAPVTDEKQEQSSEEDASSAPTSQEEEDSKSDSESEEEDKKEDEEKKENFRTENSYPQKVTGKLPLNNRQFSFIMRKKEFG